MTTSATPDSDEAIWRQQPIEQLRLLNTAFLGMLLNQAAKGYSEEKNGNGMPYPLAFVAMPAVLQKATRENIPRAISTSLAAWLIVHPSALAGFPGRAKGIAPLVRHSIAASHSGGLLKIEGSRIHPAGDARRLSKYRRDCATPEIVDCLRKANFVGRWFAAAGDYTTVMALWGVRP